MNIVMFTNTFSPHVGGVARSVAAFAQGYRARGHRVLVVAPELDGRPVDERGVVRVPAVQHFNGTDFALPLPVPGWLSATLDEFRPDVVHAHHPFLLGDTALRVGAAWEVPVVFTHHTQYEKYTHYVPGDSVMLQRFVKDLATGYANLADAVIAPSHSIADVLRHDGVTQPVWVVPTGVDPSVFSPGDTSRARRRFHLPEGAFVIGHVGRLAPEKNLAFLTRCVTRAMRRCRHARFLLVGAGPLAAEIRSGLQGAGLGERLHMPGELSGPALTDAYRAMDVFVFASQTETQGMVLAEALATGAPVVAVDAPGVREIVRDEVNGKLIPTEDERRFVRGLLQVSALTTPARADLRRAVLASSGDWTIDRSVQLALALYGSLAGRGRAGDHTSDSLWSLSVRRIRRELEILGNLATAAGDAVFGLPRNAVTRAGVS